MNKEKPITIEVWLDNLIHPDGITSRVWQNFLVSEINWIRDEASKLWVELVVIPYEWMISPLSGWRINQFNNEELDLLVSALNNSWISFSLALNWWMHFGQSTFDLKSNSYAWELFILNSLTESWLKNWIKNRLTVYLDDLHTQIKNIYWNDWLMMYASSIKLQEIPSENSKLYQDTLIKLLTDYDKVVLDNLHAQRLQFSNFPDFIDKFVIHISSWCWMTWLSCREHFLQLGQWNENQLVFLPSGKSIVEETCMVKPLLHIWNSEILTRTYIK